LKQNVEQLLLPRKFKHKHNPLELIGADPKNKPPSRLLCFTEVITNQQHLFQNDNHDFTLFLSSPLNVNRTDIVNVRAANRENACAVIILQRIV
jgi:hypothetical protein